MANETHQLAADQLLDLLLEIGQLKNLPRTGWRFHGIKDCESIADHCYRMALLCMVLGDMLRERGVEVDVDKMVRMALLHEIGEARIGDVPFIAFPYLKEENKEEAERKAVQDMLDGLGRVSQSYVALWDRFDQQTDLEAILVRACDKLELMIQVYEYERQGHRSLDRFWENPWNQRGFDTHALIREIMDRLLLRRSEVFGRPPTSSTKGD